MRVLYPGHRYALANLKSDTETILQFMQDPPLHPACDGTSCQEVIRVLIDRVQALDAELPWEGNHSIIIPGLRQSLGGFEVRAILRKIEKGLPIERLPVADDGHLKFATASGIEAPSGVETAKTGSIEDESPVPPTAADAQKEI